MTGAARGVGRAIDQAQLQEEADVRCAGIDSEFVAGVAGSARTGAQGGAARPIDAAVDGADGDDPTWRIMPGGS